MMQPLRRLVYLSAVVFLALVPGILIAAEDEAVVELDLANFDIIPPHERWEFSPPHERRDVFYDLEAIHQARQRIIRLGEELQQETVVDADTDPLIDGPVTTLEESLERAQTILAAVQQAMAAQRWDEALTRSNNGIRRLTTIAQDYEDPQEIRQVIERLARYAVLAEEAKLLKEAREQFAQLDLTVEGIMWSADEHSLAIISGETFAPQDRVKNTLIVNIDVNRVDFMFTYQGRRFEFQRYIGE